MMDEVTRLRQLRKTALKVRALASSLDTGRCESNTFERAAVLHWRIARIATGKLRSHPYKNYQRDPGRLESACDRGAAFIVAKLANLRGQGLRAFLEQLSSAAREVADARALTLSSDLSDALGRAQKTVQVLIDEVRGQVAGESAGIGQVFPEDAVDDMTGGELSASPYLAL
jgi:hypothetical protein